MQCRVGLNKNQQSKRQEIQQLECGIGKGRNCDFIQAKGGLAAKMGKMQPMDRHRRPALYPELLQEVVDDLLSDKWAGGQLQELLYHAYGCPWLQALLLSLEGHRWASLKLLQMCLTTKFVQCSTSTILINYGIKS